MEAGKRKTKQKGGMRAGVRQELPLGSLGSPLCLPKAPWHEAQSLAKNKTRWPSLQLPCQPLSGWAARERPRVPGLREYIMLFLGCCCKEVCSAELIEQLLAQQEKSHYIPFTALGAGLQKHKNPCLGWSHKRVRAVLSVLARKEIPFA